MNFLENSERFEKKWENGTFPGWPVSFSGVWVEGHSREVNYFTLILSLCFRPSDAGPFGISCARRCSLPCWVFSVYFGKRFVRAHLPLAEPSIFTNRIITALWFLLTKSWYNYVLEIFIIYFHSWGQTWIFSEISGRIGPSSFSWCVFFSFLLCS